MKLKRTNSTDTSFIRLVSELDTDLRIKDGDEHSFFAQFNHIDSIKHVIVAYAGTAAVGCGAIKEYSNGIMEVKRMFTVPSERGKGIASAILRALESWALELGYDTCILETGRNNPEAIRLYQKRGYLETPNYGQYKNVVSSICFKKVLSPHQRTSEQHVAE